MTLDELKVEAKKYGYKLVKIPEWTCYCGDAFPRTPRCAVTHELVKTSRRGGSYCKKRPKQS